MLSGDELGEILKALHEAKLPAELGAEDEEDEGMEGGGRGVKGEKRTVCGCDEEEHT